jgi:transposase-like protein
VDKGGAGKGSGRRWYSPEFKAEAVREVLDGPRPVSRVSVEIGVDEGTLRRWVQLERRRRAGGPDAPAPAARGGDGASDAARIRELERELREARQEADFLKKAAAFFARDHR